MVRAAKRATRRTPAKVRFARGLRDDLAACKRDRNTRRFYSILKESLAEGHLRPEDFHIRNLFEEVVPNGRELIEHFNPDNQDEMDLLEDEGAVKTTDFANITGQIVYAKVMEGWNNPRFLWPEVVTVVPTQFDGEKIPGIGAIGDAAETVAEGMPYPTAGLGEEWVETPTTIKKGLIIPVTKEAVFYDRTGLVLKNAGEVGHAIGVNREKRVLDVVLGITTSYRRNGTAADSTYADTHTSGDFDNLAATNALVDWTDVEVAELLFDGITDPNTGEPVDVMVDTIIVPTALKHTARRINNATFVRHGTDPVTQSDSPINDYNILTSAYVKNRTSSTTTWFIGEPKRAFHLMENWGITVSQAPANSEAEFNNDIVARFKGSERSAVAVVEPRRMVKCTA